MWFIPMLLGFYGAGFMKKIARVSVSLHHEVPRYSFWTFVLSYSTADLRSIRGRGLVANSRNAAAELLKLCDHAIVRTITV